MPQIVECRKCSKRFQAPDQLAGKSLLCPVCKTIITIPPLKAAAAARKSAAALPASPPPMGVAQCPHCTKKFKAPVKLQGKTVPCPSCKAAFNIRFAAATAPPAPESHSDCRAAASENCRRRVAQIAATARPKNRPLQHPPAQLYDEPPAPDCSILRSPSPSCRSYSKL